MTNLMLITLVGGVVGDLWAFSNDPHVVFWGLPPVGEGFETCGFTPRPHLLWGDPLCLRWSVLARALGVEFCYHGERAGGKETRDVAENSLGVIRVM